MFHLLLLMNAGCPNRPLVFGLWVVKALDGDLSQLTNFISKFLGHGLVEGLVPKPYFVNTILYHLSRYEWDLLFQPMFDESLNLPPNVDLQAPEVIAPIPEVVAPEHVVSTGSPSSLWVKLRVRRYSEKQGSVGRLWLSSRRGNRFEESIRLVARLGLYKFFWRFADNMNMSFYQMDVKTAFSESMRIMLVVKIHAVAHLVVYNFWVYRLAESWVVYKAEKRCAYPLRKPEYIALCRFKALDLGIQIPCIQLERRDLPGLSTSFEGEIGSAGRIGVKGGKMWRNRGLRESGRIMLLEMELTLETNPPTRCSYEVLIPILQLENPSQEEFHKLNLTESQVYLQDGGGVAKESSSLNFQIWHSEVASSPNGNRLRDGKETHAWLMISRCFKSSPIYCKILSSIMHKSILKYNASLHHIHNEKVKCKSYKDSKDEA
ncbi:hypothetical protein Tco_0110902 [Tanacetum coccineum]